MRDGNAQRPSSDRLSRRQYLAFAGGSTVALTAGLSGCSSDSGDDSNGNGNEGTDGANVGPPDSGSNTVTLASLHSLSGTAAESGQKVANGVKLAVQLKNENGGIEALDDARVELLERDHEGKQELAGEEAKSSKRPSGNSERAMQTRRPPSSGKQTPTLSSTKATRAAPFG